MSNENIALGPEPSTDLLTAERPNRYTTHIKRLVFCQLVLSALITIFGISVVVNDKGSVVILLHRDFDTYKFLESSFRSSDELIGISGICTGVLGLMTSSFGLALLKKPLIKCYGVTFMVHAALWCASIGWLLLSRPHHP